MLNILTKSIIRYKRDDGAMITASLPQVYAALMNDEAAIFPALRPHQRHAWHAFLVQLGAMAMHKANLTEPPADADEWRRIIRVLTLDFPDDEPWQLVVDDITKPAFMQPPASSEDRRADYKSAVATPDELDMLVTSKNHDLKAAVSGAQGDTDDWLFALITLQTMEGYSGSRNYGISRMPSGYGNRPAFSITPSISLRVHVKRDIMALLEHRQTIVDDYEYPSDGGIKLLWTVPWDGAKSESILINWMDPLYIEICRRIRLRWKDGKMSAIRANSASRRIVDSKGLTGDPWAPVGSSPNQRGTPPAFLGPRKFGYERVVDGLFSPDWKQPYLLASIQFDKNYLDENDSENMQLVARGIIRGEGGTSGYHERIIPMRHPMAQNAMLGRPQAKQLEDMARERIEEIGKVKDILRHAVATFAAQGESNDIKNDIKTEHWKLARHRTDKLDEIVDTTFFNDLQDEFEADESERVDIRKRWLMNGNDGVVDHARGILRQAEDSLPCPAVQCYRARVRADSVFEGKIKSSDGLPFLFEREREENEAWQNSSSTAQEQNPTEAQLTLFQ